MKGVRQILNRYSLRYTGTFAFSRFLYPLSNSAFLAVGLLCYRPFREPVGLTLFRVSDIRLWEGSDYTPGDLCPFAI